MGNSESRPNTTALAWLIMISVGLMLLVCGFIVCFSSGESAQGALKAAGMTDVKITGWVPFACPDSSGTSTGFDALNAQGKAVQGVVCCSKSKPCSVHVEP